MIKMFILLIDYENICIESNFMHLPLLLFKKSSSVLIKISVIIINDAVFLKIW